MCSLELLSVILTSGIKKLNLKREMKWIVVVVVKVCRHENGLLESFDSCTLYYRSAIKVLLYTRQLIYFLATCLASLSRHKLHKINMNINININMVKHALKLICLSISFVAAFKLQQVEVGSMLCNGDCNRNVARYVRFRECCTRQDPCNLWHNGAINCVTWQVVRQLLPSVTAPFLVCVRTRVHVLFWVADNVTVFIIYFNVECRLKFSNRDWWFGSLMISHLDSTIIK